MHARLHTGEAPATYMCVHTLTFGSKWILYEKKSSNLIRAADPNRKPPMTFYE